MSNKNINSFGEGASGAAAVQPGGGGTVRSEGGGDDFVPAVANIVDAATSTAAVTLDTAGATVADTQAVATPTQPTKIAGDLIVANKVLAELAGYAALESYGIVGMAAPNVQDEIAKLLPIHKLQRGILLSFDEAGVASVELHVIIEHGTNLSAVSQNLADSVRYTLEHFAQIEVAEVYVHVEGIHIQKSDHQHGRTFN